VEGLNSRVPHTSFFEGWDSTVVSRVGFLADSCSALVHRVRRWSPSPTPSASLRAGSFRKRREKAGAPGAKQLPVSGETVLASICPRVW
jgi:hypothetical protein